MATPNHGRPSRGSRSMNLVSSSAQRAPWCTYFRCSSRGSVGPGSALSSAKSTSRRAQSVANVSRTSPSPARVLTYGTPGTESKRRTRSLGATGHSRSRIPKELQDEVDDAKPSPSKGPAKEGTPAVVTATRSSRLSITSGGSLSVSPLSSRGSLGEVKDEAASTALVIPKITTPAPTPLNLGRLSLNPFANPFANSLAPPKESPFAGRTRPSTTTTIFALSPASSADRMDLDETPPSRKKIRVPLQIRSTNTPLTIMPKEGTPLQEEQPQGLGPAQEQLLPEGHSAEEESLAAAAVETKDIAESTAADLHVPREEVPMACEEIRKEDDEQEDELQREEVHEEVHEEVEQREKDVLQEEQREEDVLQEEQREEDVLQEEQREEDVLQEEQREEDVLQEEQREEDVVQEEQREEQQENPPQELEDEVPEKREELEEQMVDLEEVEDRPAEESLHETEAPSPQAKPVAAGRPSFVPWWERDDDETDSLGRSRSRSRLSVASSRKSVTFRSPLTIIQSSPSPSPAHNQYSPVCTRLSFSAPTEVSPCTTSKEASPVSSPQPNPSGVTGKAAKKKGKEKKAKKSEKAEKEKKEEKTDNEERKAEPVEKEEEEKVTKKAEVEKEEKKVAKKAEVAKEEKKAAKVEKKAGKKAESSRSVSPVRSEAPVKPRRSMSAPSRKAHAKESEQTLQKLTVAELKTRARRLGVKVGGLKAELVERILQAQKGQGASDASEDTPPAPSSKAVSATVTVSSSRPKKASRAQPLSPSKAASASDAEVEQVVLEAHKKGALESVKATTLVHFLEMRGVVPSNRRDRFILACSVALCLE